MSSIARAFLVASLVAVPSAGAAPACPGNTTAEDVIASVDLTGTVAIVTGGDSGLGYATAEALARRGATVVIGNRNQTHGEQAAKNLSALTGAEVAALQLDLGSLASVHSFAEAFLEKYGPKLNFLINNAGIGSPSVMSADGFELVFEVDYLGHFLLTELMLPALRANSPAKVVNVASAGHTMACSSAGWPDDCFKNWTYLPPPALSRKAFIGPTYGIAKFLQIQHAKGLALREAQLGSGVEAFSVNPGFTLTPAMGPNFDPNKPGLKAACAKQVHPDPSLPAQACPFSPAQGAAVITFCATSLAAQPGVYYDRKFACEEGKIEEHGFTEAMVPELYRRSLGWAGLTAAAPPGALAAALLV